MANAAGQRLEATDVLAAALEQHQAGRHDDAERLYRQALDADPREPTALYLYGLMVFEAGRADEAADLFEQVVALRPDHVEAQITLARLRHWRGEPVAAIEGYSRALALDATRADAAVGLANALRESGDVAGAIEAGRAVSSRFPSDAAARASLGAALFAAGELEAAIDAYRIAIDLDPASTATPRPWPWRCWTPVSPSRLSPRPARRSISTRPLPRHGSRGAAASLALRRPEEAITALEWASAIDPSRAATQLTLGNAYAEADHAGPRSLCPRSRARAGSRAGRGFTPAWARSIFAPMTRRRRNVIPGRRWRSIPACWPRTRTWLRCWPNREGRPTPGGTATSPIRGAICSSSRRPGRA